MKNLKILTDDSCCFYIYESTGCRKVYETVVKDYEYVDKECTLKENAYIFAKNLIV